MRVQPRCDYERTDNNYTGGYDLWWNCGIARPGWRDWLFLIWSVLAFGD